MKKSKKVQQTRLLSYFGRTGENDYIKYEKNLADPLLKNSTNISTLMQSRQ